MRARLASVWVAAAACLALAYFVLTQRPGPEAPPAAQASPAAQATLYDTEVHRLTSTFAEQEYRLLVALPRGYAESEARYPALYVLDADILFGTITETARLLTLEGVFVGLQSVPNLILVGIAYPGGFDEMAEKRGRDFTPTTELDSETEIEPGNTQPDGADRFFRFLSEQAIPFIDASYRTARDDRTLIGTSTGGAFILDTLLCHPGTFQRYIATSPRMDDILFRHEAAFAQRNQDLNAVLYLSAGTEGEIEQQIARAVERFGASLAARGYPRLKLITESLEGENHVSAQPTAFTHGLKAVYRN